MLFIRLLPIIFSTILAAAHVMRFYGLNAAILVLLLLGTLFIRKHWILRFWQALHGVFVAMWILVTINLVQMRMALEAPWGRLAIIMIAVILFTIFSGFWLESKKIKLAYNYQTNGN